MDGKGFEPTIDALFGKNGFFPDTVSKALYWAEDKMPLKIKEVLEKWVSPLKSEGQKVYFVSIYSVKHSQFVLFYLFLLIPSPLIQELNENTS